MSRSPTIRESIIGEHLAGDDPFGMEALYMAARTAAEAQIAESGSNVRTDADSDTRASEVPPMEPRHLARLCCVNVLALTGTDRGTAAEIADAIQSVCESE